MPVAPGNSEDVKKALLNLEMDTPSLVDEKAAAFKDYRVMLTPRVYLLDPAGKILMRGTPDMLFDANLYAVMGKLEGKKNGKADEKKAPAAPAAVKPAPLPARINSPDTRIPSVPQPAALRPAAPPASSGVEQPSSLSAPPLRHARIACSMENIPLRKAAEAVARVLAGAGHTVYFVGGCVRDRLLGYPVKDIDIATSARPDEVLRLFPDAWEVGAAFGVVLVRRGGFSFEVATFRRDGSYRDGRRPESVCFTDAEEDARRRDFTMNGLFEDPFSVPPGYVVDYVGGVEDIRVRVLRCIGEPDRRFEEDSLRADARRPFRRYQGSAGGSGNLCRHLQERPAAGPHRAGAHPGGTGPDSIVSRKETGRGNAGGNGTDEACYSGGIRHDRLHAASPVAPGGGRVRPYADDAGRAGEGRRPRVSGAGPGRAAA